MGKLLGRTRFGNYCCRLEDYVKNRNLRSKEKFLWKKEIKKDIK